MNFTQTLILAYIIFVPFSHVLLSFLFDYNEDQMTKKKLMLYICACIGWPILIPVGFINFFITYWKSLPYDSQTIDDEEEVCKPKSFDEPDWSKAPDWAKWFEIDEKGLGFWHEYEPKKTSSGFRPTVGRIQHNGKLILPTLFKRPEQ